MTPSQRAQFAIDNQIQPIKLKKTHKCSTAEEEDGKEQGSAAEEEEGDSGST